MKTFFKLALAVGLAALSVEIADAQGSSFNAFDAYRCLDLGLTNQIGNANVGITNAAVDVHHLTGIAKVDLFCKTNAAGGVTCNLETSADTTNWVAVANYALASATSVIYTNTYYGTNNLTATNIFLLPGTVSTPTAATAGWATPYLLPAPYTNSGTITMSGNQAVEVGFKIDDQLRYIRTRWTFSGAATNVVVEGLLTARLAE
jgi:hypothetical protein